MSDTRPIHIRSSYFYGGPERQITYLTAALRARGVQSAVATFSPVNNPDRNRYFIKLRELGIPAYRIDIRGSYDRSALTVLERIIADGGFSVIIGHDYRADYFVLRLGKRLRLPAVSFSRGWTRNTLKVRLYEWLDRRFLKKMDGVVAVSRDKYGELKRKGVDPARMIHIPNSIPMGDRAARTLVTRKRYRIPHDAFLVGTAGRLSVEKRQDVFIRAAVSLLDRQGASAPWFLIAGEGPRADHLAGMIPAKYRQRIIFAGWIENTEDFYADIDLFVLTSATEGFPNVLLEAGTYRLPAISTPAGGATDIIEHEKTGLLFDFGDADTLADYIKRLAADSEYRSRLGDGLGEITRRKYDVRVNADILLDFLRKVEERHGQT
jgi:glycosyltransferase involved in cell wall biosynthesis